MSLDTARRSATQECVRHGCGRQFSWYSKVSFGMALRISFPRICIALGISDPVQLFEYADREAVANESFFEFRLDYPIRN